MIRVPKSVIRAQERVRQAPRPGNRKWYRIENADTDEATVYVYDYIGWYGVEAEPFVRELQAITAETIHVRINSPGGNVFDGSAIYNALKQHPARVVVHIDGLAASIASIIALVGDEVRMAEGAFFMIHNPYMAVIGDAGELRKAADLLDKVRAQLAGIYVRKTGKELEDILEWMDEEKWLSAEEAQEAGFVDQVSDTEAAEAGFDLSVFDRVPDRLARTEPKQKSRTIRTIRDAETTLREEGGFSRAAAKAVIAAIRKATSEPRDEVGKPRSVAAVEQLIATISS